MPVCKNIVDDGVTLVDFVPWVSVCLALSTIEDCEADVNPVKVVSSFVIKDFSS